MLESLRERTEALMLGRVTWPGMFFQMDATTVAIRDAPLGLGWQGPSLNYRKMEKLELDERFARSFDTKRSSRWCERSSPGASRSTAPSCSTKPPQVAPRFPGIKTRASCRGLIENPEVQVWTALDDAPENGGCLEFVPGSHRWGLATPLGGVVPDDRVAQTFAPVAVPVKAGESVLLHNFVWHRSGKTHTGHRRLGFSACYLNDRVKCVRKKRTPRQFFEVFP